MTSQNLNEIVNEDISIFKMLRQTKRLLPLVNNKLKPYKNTFILFQVMLTVRKPPETLICCVKILEWFPKSPSR